MTDMMQLDCYTPEQISDTMDLLFDSGVSAIIFKGMAASVADRLDELHEQNYRHGVVNKYSYSSNNVAQGMVDLGFDLEHFRNQPLDAEKWPEDTIQTTTIELIESGRHTDWHTDVAWTDSRNTVYLPYGVAFSINLAYQAVYRIAQELHPFYIPDRTLTLQDLNRLKNESLIADIGDTEFLETVADPGDVVAWRQPAAHKVEPLDPRRRSIVLIQEDYVELSSN